RGSERAWIATLFCGLFLVLASGRQPEVGTLALLAQMEAAALGALLALWVSRSSDLRRYGLAIALAALFTTPLLPYAFVEHELTLPLLLFTAGFLAIGPNRLRSPVRELALLLASAGVLLASPSGLLLLPLLIWLAWCAAERGGAERPSNPRPRFYAATAILLVLFALRAWTLDLQAIALVDSPIDWLVHVHGFLLSLNKGLLLFAPLVLIGLWRSFRGAVSERNAARFALYSAASLIVPCAGLTRWSDASWGPRPLLAACAPALLALALSSTERARRGGHRRWILAAVVLGLAVNTLGTAIPQTALAALPSLPQEGRSVALQFDPAWNHARIDAALLGRWVGTNLPEALKAEEAGVPANTEAAEIVLPGPLLLRAFDAGERAALAPRALLLALAGAIGWTLLVLVRHASKS
ncbi:MAG: hypothetical protein ABIV06_08175, partial [Thermoanaerobaculia bacterium]